MAQNLKILKIYSLSVEHCSPYCPSLQAFWVKTLLVSLLLSFSVIVLPKSWNYPYLCLQHRTQRHSSDKVSVLSPPLLSSTLLGSKTCWILHHMSVVSPLWFLSLQNVRQLGHAAGQLAEWVWFARLLHVVHPELSVSRFKVTIFVVIEKIKERLDALEPMRILYIFFGHNSILLPGCCQKR